MMEYDDIFQIIKKGSSDKIQLLTSMLDLERAVQTVCSFLNNDGGIVIIGVDHNNFYHGQKISRLDLEKLAVEVDKIAPTASIEISTFPTLEGKYLIILKTNRGDNIPYLFEEIAYDRIGTQTVIMTPIKYNKLLMKKKYIS